jgi:glycosyltransferase involved in cell wall biosynthesis
MCLHTCSAAFTLDFVSIRPAIRPDEVWQWPASAFEAPSDVEQTVKHIIPDYVETSIFIVLRLGTMERSLITFAVVAFNQERVVAEAVQGTLGQTYNPLEIILSDDCSPDRTFEVMKKQVANYSGPHQVQVRRNEKNLGLIGHINCIMDLAKGELIVIAAGDDISLPHRTERIWEEYVASGCTACSLFSNAIWIDETGQRQGLLRRVPTNPTKLTVECFASSFLAVNGCTHAWHRKVFDVFGPMLEMTNFEDVVIPFRSALLGQVRYIDEPLVLYRWNSPETLCSVDSFYEMLSSKIQPQLQICLSRLRDLDTLLELYPDRYGQVQELRNITYWLLTQTKEERVLLEANPVRRVQIIVKALFERHSMRQVRRWVLVHLFPHLYLLKLKMYLIVQKSRILRRIVYGPGF